MDKKLVTVEKYPTPSGFRYLFYCVLAHVHDTRHEAANCSRAYLALSTPTN
jgi:hypothetical protein